MGQKNKRKPHRSKENLVMTGNKGGYYVKPMMIGDIHEVRELREILELGAVQLAVKRITPAHTTALQSICDDFTKMVKQQYYSGALEADMRFHEKLVECSGNSKLVQAYQSSHIPLFHQKLGTTKAYMEDYAQTDKEHRQVVKALKQKDAAQAQKILKQHFQRGEAAITDLE
jgi:DNA-binding GntR family transcriptional regulator